MKTLIQLFSIGLMGLASITAQAQDKNGRMYSAGEIQSKTELVYGRFELMMYSSDVSGTTSTFFLWKEGGTRSDSRWNELDIETFGKSPSSWQSNPIWQSHNNDPVKKMWEVVHSDIPIAKTWVKFTLEWTPEYIAWFNNDIEVRRIERGETLPTDHFRYKKESPKASPVEEIADPMRMSFNHWSTFPGDWLGPFNPEELPSFQFVDWITYQPWIGNGFGSVEIRHDFNSMEEVTSAFHVSGHTFSENQCTFQPANVGVVNGLLWLSITPYDQSRPPSVNEVPMAP
jgi:endo-1,3-1,4-beta-glycanase ExoK